MSQAGSLTSGSTPVIPPNIPTSFVEDSGVATPAANIINVFGGDTTDDNILGLQTTGAGNTITIELTNRLRGQAGTLGAGTLDLVTFPLGAVPGGYEIEFKIVGYAPLATGSIGGYLRGTITTDGATAGVVEIPDKIIDVDPSIALADFDLVVSGNSAIVQVTGVAGQGINWLAIGEYLFVS